MAQHTGKIEGREGSNILICGKRFYVPPEKQWLFEKYPQGSPVTLTEVKGTVSMITPLNGNATIGTTAAVNPATNVDPIQTSSSTPAAKPKAVKEVNSETPVAPRQINGFRDSDRIGWQAVLNTAVSIVDPSWRDDPNKSIHENVSARLDLVKATASGLHVFITEKMNGVPL